MSMFTSDQCRRNHEVRADELGYTGLTRTNFIEEVVRQWESWQHLLPPTMKYIIQIPANLELDREKK